MNDNKRPKPDPTTIAEIDRLNAEQRDTLARVLAAHPTLTHKEALEHCKAGGL